MTSFDTFPPAISFLKLLTARKNPATMKNTDATVTAISGTALLVTTRRIPTKARIAPKSLTATLERGDLFADAVAEPPVVAFTAFFAIIRLQNILFRKKANDFDC